MLYHYIFGYGSLICAHSRAVTAPQDAHKAATPVTVYGVERVWSKRSQKLGMTAMGIRMQEGASTVGVILPVSEADLALFDQREQGYSRVLIHLDDVDMVPFLGDKYYEHEDHKVFLDAKRSNKHDSVKVWAYLPHTITPADPDHPIVQSYVDTILRGCLDVGGEQFAKEFIQQTKGWNPEELLEEESSGGESVELSRNDSMYSSTESVWVDDRDEPVYIRGDPSHSRKNASKFDRLLRTYNPDTFEERKPIQTTE